MSISAIIGLHLLELNHRRLLSLESCLYDRGLHVCKNVRKIFTSATTKHIPLFSTTSINPIDFVNIEYFGLQEIETKLIHVPLDNGHYRCCVQVKGESVPGFNNCGPGLVSVTTLLPLVEYDTDGNGEIDYDEFCKMIRKIIINEEEM